MDNAGPGRNNLEVLECLRPPFEELESFIIASKLDFFVLLESVVNP